MRTRTCSFRLNEAFPKSLVLAGLVVTLAGCPSLPPPPPNGGPGDLPKKASDWVSFVDWDQATRVVITAKEDGEHFFFEPADQTFEAGKPYILEMKSASSNGAKHYFHSPEFYKAIATRKAQTSNAEYKAPYFDDFELLTGGTLELYFVPVKAGTYEMWCTVEGHKEAGMEGVWTITGGEGYELELEVADNFNTALAADGRRSGDDAVWQAGNLATQTVTLTEYAFTPNEYTLTKNIAYKLTLAAPAGNLEKHYHTAAELYKTVVTRKAQDSQAEIKVPYLNAVELIQGGSTDLYIVPTVAGAYELLCTVPGHADLGMTGTITVVDAQLLPSKASDWVSFVDWDDATRVEITAEEEDADHYHFVPADVTFEAGKPYILEMKSPAANDEKHYFHTDGFYKAIATRKAQTVDAEYKAPYFDDFELLTGGTLELYFVPVKAGAYNMWCTVEGHQALGMEGVWTITGGAGYELELEVADDFNTDLAADERRSGSDDVWQEGNLLTQTVTLTEYSFDPSEYTLTKDVGYKLTLTAPAGNLEKHYHTAAELYKTLVTRKAQDSQAEIKVPYLNAVELIQGGSTDLYIVPTVVGSYGLLCTVPGHADLGMTGTISVE